MTTCRSRSIRRSSSASCGGIASLPNRPSPPGLIVRNADRLAAEVLDEARSREMDDHAVRCVLRKDNVLPAFDETDAAGRVVIIELDPILVLVFADAQAREAAAEFLEGCLHRHAVHGRETGRSHLDLDRL